MMEKFWKSERFCEIFLENVEVRKLQGWLHFLCVDKWVVFYGGGMSSDVWCDSHHYL